MELRIDHSIFLQNVMKGIDEATMAVLEPLGYLPEDFESKLSGDLSQIDYFIFSFWADPVCSLYRHRDSGILVPFSVPATDWARNALDLPAEVLETNLKIPFAREAIAHLRRGFDFVGVINPVVFRDNVCRLIDALPGDKPIIILLPKDTWLDDRGVEQADHFLTPSNTLLRELKARYPNVSLLDVKSHLSSSDDAFDNMHFRRQVYHRINENAQMMAATFINQRGVLEGA